LLIIFYINYERINNGLFTLFQNRVGDLFFVLFIVGVLDIRIGNNIILKYGLLVLVLGGCVKRAQYPFNSWLLAAMRAPTPISSLVHSSTLVVAGVYILLQFSYCLIDVLEVLKYIRVLTLLISRFGLLIEFDIKKLIAYSTLRHVSLIILILRLKLFKVTYFHLNVHAIFKSTIFICFGFVILSSYHRQDKRMVRLNNLNPLIKTMYYFSCLCLIGLPFLSGFFSKDFIIEKLIEVSREFYLVVLLLVFLRIRVYYGIKLINLIHTVFSYSIVEKRYLGMISVLLIIRVIILIVNVFIRFIVRLRLEIMSFKMMIYFFILGFFLLRVIRNLNIKFNFYDKRKNFFEV
jgi:NADH-ubiquinone oxidoreductase chain 5